MDAFAIVVTRTSGGYDDDFHSVQLVGLYSKPEAAVAAAKSPLWDREVTLHKEQRSGDPGIHVDIIKVPIGTILQLGEEWVTGTDVKPVFRRFYVIPDKVWEEEWPDDTFRDQV